MALLPNIFRRQSSPAKPEHIGFSADLNRRRSRVPDDFGGFHRDSEEAAKYVRTSYPVLGTPAGVQAVSLICHTISSLPVYCVNSRGSEVPDPEWVKVPAPKVPELDFRAVLNHIVSSLVLEGIAYVGVTRMGKTPKGLLLVEPGSVKEELVGNNRVFHIQRDLFGGTLYIDSRPRSDFWDRYVSGVGRTFGSDDMLIWLGATPIPGGLRGVGSFDLIADSVGVATAAQRYAYEHYALYAHAPSVMTMKAGAIPQDKKEQLERDFKEIMSGTERGVPKVLYTSGPPKDDLMFQQVGATPNEASIAGVSEFQGSQIAMAADVPLSLLGGQAGGSSYNSLKSQKQHWLETSILPLVSVVERTFDRLLPEGHQLKLDTTQLMKGDPQTTAQVVRELVRLGVLNIQEGRELMGYEPVEGSDKKGAEMIILDGNRKPLEQVIKEPEPPAPMPGMPGQPQETPQVPGKPPGSKGENENTTPEMN